MIADDIRLSRAMADAVGRHAELQLVTQELSITTFRYVPRDLRHERRRAGQVERHLDALNRELLDRLQRGGEAFVSNAVVGGRYVLRACIVNFHTARADVEAVPEIVARMGRTVDARCVPPSQAESRTMPASWGCANASPGRQSPPSVRQGRPASPGGSGNRSAGLVCGPRIARRR